MLRVAYSKFQHLEVCDLLINLPPALTLTELHNEKTHTLYRLPNIDSVIK